MDEKQAVSGVKPRKFSIVDGEDGWTLGCDCYGGCWGEHSKNWPRLHFGDKADAHKAYNLCHQEMEVGVDRPKAERIGHGNYVLGSDNSLRFSTRALLDAHVLRLERLLGW